MGPWRPTQCRICQKAPIQTKASFRRHQSRVHYRVWSPTRGTSRAMTAEEMAEACTAKKIRQVQDLVRHGERAATAFRLRSTSAGTQSGRKKPPTAEQTGAVAITTPAKGQLSQLPSQLREARARQWAVVLKAPAAVTTAKPTKVLRDASVESDELEPDATVHHRTAPARVFAPKQRPATTSVTPAARIHTPAPPTKRSNGKEPMKRAAISPGQTKQKPEEKETEDYIVEVEEELPEAGPSHSKRGRPASPTFIANEDTLEYVLLVGIGSAVRAAKEAAHPPLSQREQEDLELVYRTMFDTVAAYQAIEAKLAQKSKESQEARRAFSR